MYRSNTTGMGWARPAPPKSKSSPIRFIKYNCTIKNRLYHREDATNKGIGYFSTSIVANNKLNLVPIRKTIVKKGPSKLDAGKQGVVFLASTESNVPTGSEFVIKVCPRDKALATGKQIADVEFKIQTLLYKIAPDNIPMPIAPLINCADFIPSSELRSKSVQVNTNKDYVNQTVMFSEYIPYGPLSYYLKKIGKKLNDTVVRSFIHQVIYTIYKIRRKYPGFRHNDLHLDNILVKPGRPVPLAVLNDFGFSTLGANITRNPTVNRGNFAKEWGIGPKTSPDYDIHLFLNEMRKACDKLKSESSDGLSKSISFLNSIIPQGYRNDGNRYLSHMRLRYNIKYPGFPSIRQILKSRYFEEGSSKSLTPSPKNRMPYTNANLKHMGLSPNFRKWAMTRKRNNTPAAAVKPRKAKVNIINLTGNSASPPKKKAKVIIINLTGNSASPPKKAKSKTVSVSPPKKAKSKSASASSSVYTVRINKNKTPPFPKMNLATRRRLNRISGRYEVEYQKKNPTKNYSEVRNYGMNRARKLVMKRLKAGRSPFSPSPKRSPPKAVHSAKSKQTREMSKLKKNLMKRRAGKK